MAVRGLPINVQGNDFGNGPKCYFQPLLHGEYANEALLFASLAHCFCHPLQGRKCPRKILLMPFQLQQAVLARIPGTAVSDCGALLVARLEKALAAPKAGGRPNREGTFFPRQSTGPAATQNGHFFALSLFA